MVFIGRMSHQAAELRLPSHLVALRRPAMDRCELEDGGKLLVLRMHLAQAGEIFFELAVLPGVLVAMNNRRLPRVVRPKQTNSGPNQTAWKSAPQNARQNLRENHAKKRAKKRSKKRSAAWTSVPKSAPNFFCTLNNKDCRAVAGR